MCLCAVIQLSQNSYTVVTQLLHYCCYTPQIHVAGAHIKGYNVVTLLLHCCHTP
jgi:hypothetical protein